MSTTNSTEPKQFHAVCLPFDDPETTENHLVLTYSAAFQGELIMADLKIGKKIVRSCLCFVETHLCEKDDDPVTVIPLFRFMDPKDYDTKSVKVFRPGIQSEDGLVNTSGEWVDLRKTLLTYGNWKAMVRGEGISHDGASE
jgi:hypothetical protein